VLISHSHIDHFWDLVPLLWVRYLRNQKSRIKIVCPKNDTPLIEWCVKVSQNSFSPEICGVVHGEEVLIKRLIIEPFTAEHQTSIQPLSYSITEEPKIKLDINKLKSSDIPKEVWIDILENTDRYKDSSKYVSQRQRKIIYSGDSLATNTLQKKAEKADLLIIEATYPNSRIKDNEYQKQSHMTIDDALNLAIKAKVGTVLLTHLSMRYSIKDFNESIKRFQESNQKTPHIYIGNDNFSI
jgi:ribonuclease BN (tRNA processing enzyme)